MSWMTNRMRVDHGFTLIEMLVVIVVLGLLMAIAIPVFNGAKRNAQDSKAHSALRSGLAAERTYYIDYQEYTTDATALRRIESGLDWTTTDASSNGVMAALDATEQVVVLVSTSVSGNQFCIMNIAQDLAAGSVNGQTAAGTYYARNPNPVSPPSTSVATNSCGTSGYTRSETGWSG
jgi:type IV pilus assembly protein PilA